jgi:hypothetical protein
VTRRDNPESHPGDKKNSCQKFSVCTVGAMNMNDS